jgi:hypothetical protein
MEIVKENLCIVNNFILSEARGELLKVAAFDVSFDGMSKRYRGVVGNTPILSTDLWHTFWTEENEGDYDFCLTFYYDGENWRFHLSGLMSTLGEVFDNVPAILQEFGISKDIIALEDYDPFDERSTT